MPKTWKLVKYEPTSFAGINEENASSSVILFMDKPEPIVGFTGDQGTRKTSNLACIKALLGGLLPENAINSTDDTMKAAMQIVLEDGRLLDASFDKNNFRLYVTQEIAGKMTRSAVSSPKEFIRNLIGPVGVSPMFLKAMDGVKQVEWLREIAHLTKEQLDVEKTILDSYKTDFKKRTDVRREVKRLKVELDSSLYFDYDEDHKAFDPNKNYEDVMSAFEKGAGDAEAIKQRWEKASDDFNKLNQYISGKASLQEQVAEKDKVIAGKQAQIERLQEEIRLETEASYALKVRIEKADTFIAELDGAEERARKAQADMMNLSQFMTAKQTADADLLKASQHVNLSDQATLLTDKLNKWLIAKQEFVQAIAPAVKGLEVRVASEMDVEFETDAYKMLHPEAKEKEIKDHVMALEVKNKTGIFYNGASVAELCESELWDLCLILWQHMGVNVVFIENLNSLGTDAVEQINKFAKKGLVFFSQMERGQKDLQITFMNKIPTTKNVSKSAKQSTELAD